MIRFKIGRLLESDVANSLLVLRIYQPTLKNEELKPNIQHSIASALSAVLIRWYVIQFVSWLATWLSSIAPVAIEEFAGLKYKKNITRIITLQSKESNHQWRLGCFPLLTKYTANIDSRRGMTSKGNIIFAIFGAFIENQ